MKGLTSHSFSFLVHINQGNFEFRHFVSFQLPSLKTFKTLIPAIESSTAEKQSATLLKKDELARCSHDSC